MARPIYSTVAEIPSFLGLNQTGDGHNMSLRYAWEMENVNVEGGSFKPMRQGVPIAQELTSPIGTLAYLHRRFGEETGTLLVAISQVAETDDAEPVPLYGVFTKILDGSDEWEQVYPDPEDDNPEYLTVSDCDWVTYEVNRRDGSALDEPVDVLLFSNAKDGMYCLYGDDQEVVAVETPKKYGVIARYNERIWGSGIEGDPDLLQYSAPFDPMDWDANMEIPEDGAGEIMQPTWDGDSFQSLRQYGSTLLAIKRNSIWRIYGTNPGEFTMQQQYGGGTIQENTVAVYNDRAYMLGHNGMLTYDGSGAYPFLQGNIGRLMQKVNRDALGVACAGMRGGTYCLAIPTNGSEFCNAVLEYNTQERTLAVRTQISVDDFLQVDDRLFYTSALAPGRVYEMRDDIGAPLPCTWRSGYQDLGQKNSIKSAFIVYMMVESEAPAELRVGIRTEKKLKQKIFQTKPGKMTRLHLNLQGREFRLEIQSYTAVPFVIAGGVHIDLELDPD